MTKNFNGTCRDGSFLQNSGNNMAYLRTKILFVLPNTFGTQGARLSRDEKWEFYRNGNCLGQNAHGARLRYLRVILQMPFYIIRGNQDNSFARNAEEKVIMRTVAPFVITEKQGRVKIDRIVVMNSKECINTASTIFYTIIDINTAFTMIQHWKI